VSADESSEGDDELANGEQATTSEPDEQVDDG